ncbi:MAG TPA: methyltransferase domain-containing protein [Steroidobacteraceae bacterium]|nr:methyltransferase domain-containing protein [Steroidobacteraceae bacterium]
MSAESAVRHALLEHATRWLDLLKGRGRRADSLLQSAQTWEAQYAAGRWDFLAQLPELARFSILAGYIQHLKPGGAVLDTGCGQGALLSRLPGACYSRYVGIDVSGSAIAVAQKQQSERGSFLVSDCEEYSPVGHFDVVVFNEVLCCLRDPLRTVERYARSLNPDGLLLVSLCTAARGSATILRQLKLAYALVDEVEVTHSGRGISWVCAALRPMAAVAQRDA